jgi:Collagen triple helix repeat (20 copies)
MKNKLILGISAIAAGLAISACGTKTVVVPEAATPTVTVTPGAPAANGANGANGNNGVNGNNGNNGVNGDNGANGTNGANGNDGNDGNDGNNGAPAGTPPSNYAQDIANAGIVAPLWWLNRTGEQLCADWQNGESTAQTDPLLLAGGIHPNHLAVFDSITNSDVCPGASP